MTLELKSVEKEEVHRILADIDTQSWFRDDEEAKLETKLRAAVGSLVSASTPMESKERCVADFMREVWCNYTDRTFAAVVTEFGTVEKSLHTLVPRSRGRYRDHFLHVFHTYILGASVLSQVTKDPQYTDAVSELLKVVPESVDHFPFEPPRKPYTVCRRLHYLWTLMAAIHDLAVPIEHFRHIWEALNRYLGFFGLRIGALDPVFEFTAQSRFAYHLTLMARMFGSGIVLGCDDAGKKTGTYSVDPEPHPTFLNVMSRALDRLDHGVLGAEALYRSREAALLRRGELIRKGHEQDYVKYVLEQDVTRAALAVALHSAEPSEADVLLPVQFMRFPLTFLLILCDELEEFFRIEFIWEGSSVRQVELLKQWPAVKASITESPRRMDLEFSFQYGEITKEEKRALLEEYSKYLAGKGESVSFSELEDALVHKWKALVTRLQKRLGVRKGDWDACSSGVPLRLRVTFNFANSKGGTITNTVELVIDDADHANHS